MSASNHPARRYLLASGPVEDAIPTSVFDLPPNIWWPEDRAWIVVTEIDFAWTYVGGSLHLIETLLADARLEALPTKLGDKPFFDSDVVNQVMEPPNPTCFDATAPPLRAERQAP